MLVLHQKCWMIVDVYCMMLLLWYDHTTLRYIEDTPDLPHVIFPSPHSAPFRSNAFTQLLT
jgi:hypothetical protein